MVSLRVALILVRARSSSACASTGWRAKRTIIGTIICRPREAREARLWLANERFEAIIASVRRAASRLNQVPHAHQQYPGRGLPGLRRDRLHHGIHQ